jgi:pyrimidine deaminase RibD-like protein/NTP pyrophosphatase (non-canonical NTP hydrolase)
MQLAISVGKQSCRAVEPNREAPAPVVGAVIAKEGKEVATGFRGEGGPGRHAEFVALSKLRALLGTELHKLDLSEYTIYTTLEPCTIRSPDKTPCVHRIIDSGISSVVIGILDPNRVIQGDGYWLLTESGIDVHFFDKDLANEVKCDNKKYITYYKPGAWFADPRERALDNWYHAITAIYSDRNLVRSPTWMLSHLMEIVGGLSWLASDKPGKRLGVDFESYIAKSLAWWFSLCGAMGIRSVEEMLWLKFPYVCPYCEQPRCSGPKCQKIKAERKNPRWDQLASIGATNRANMPQTMEGWRKMFSSIYPIATTESMEVVFARFSEEIGELAESVRVFKILRTSFLSEASDVFAWLMKLVSLYEMKKNHTISLSSILYQRYPNRCRDCKSLVCSCPPILPKTMSRIAHDGPSQEIVLDRALFVAPQDTADRFSPGSRELAINGKSFPVNASTIQAVYEFAQGLRTATRLSGNLSGYLFQHVETWCTAALDLATRQRVNQDQFRDLTLLLQSSNRNDRQALRDLIGTVSETKIKNALLEVHRG